MKTNRVGFFLLLLVWAAAATIAGAFRVIAHWPNWVGPLFIAGLSVSFSFGLARVQWMHAVAAELPVRGIVALHVVRFLGIYFLWLYGQGRLPAEFAQRAGWGDIASALGAVALLALARTSVFWRLLPVWNVVGAIDLLVAVGTAGWLNTIRPGSMAEIAGLPLALIPLFAVPVLLGSHVFLLRQQFRGNERPLPDRRPPVSDVPKAPFAGKCPPAKLSRACRKAEGSVRSRVDFSDC